MGKEAQVTAQTLVAALERRHAKDIFVSECKNGPTHSTSHRRMDGWALLKTWSPVTAIGYEVKVSRSDWLRDEKIASYLPLCHLLYIVAPKGIVKLEELPPNVGLLEPVGDGTRLVARRKAARREVELPSDLFVYVLMSRTKITRDTNFPEDNRAYRTNVLEEWLADRAYRDRLAVYVSDKIRKKFDDQQRLLEKLDDRARSLESVKARIEELGFDTAKPVRDWEVRHKIEQVAAKVSPALLHHLQEIERGAAVLRKELEGIRDAGKAA